MAYHASLSPSSAHRWTDCTASIGAQDGIPNTDTDASRQGTCCHQIQAEYLIDDRMPLQEYLGAELLFWSKGDDHGESWALNIGGCPAQVRGPDFQGDPQAFGMTITGRVTVTQEMVDAVTSAVAFVRDVQALTGGQLFVEQSVPIGQFTGELDATGSADVILLGRDWIHVMDSKFGRAKVDAYDVIAPAHTDIVTGEHVPEKLRANLQMASYALGAIHAFGAPAIKTVTMTIVQPFVNHISEYTCTIEELREVESFLRTKANETRTNPKFSPSQDNCHFCRASGACRAQDTAIIDAALMGLEDVPAPKPVKDMELGTKFALVGMVQDWCKAVEDRVWDALHAGQPVCRNDGLSYKLVVGKKGNRAWANNDSAVAAMQAAKLTDDQIYTKSVVGPATIEKLAKAKKGTAPVLAADKWLQLQTLITQADGKPAIALETDPRPAIAAATDGFDDVPPVDNSDLF
jgi:hypothetical protein